MLGRSARREPAAHQQPNVLRDSHQLLERAAAHLTSAVPVVQLTDTVGDVFSLLHTQAFDCASHIVACDGETFRGIIRIEDLLVADPASDLTLLADTEAPTVGPGVDQEMAAWRATKRAESALCVVDEAGHFVGLIPPHQLLAVVLQEHDEDMARLGGFLKSSTMARLASEEPLLRRFLHRLPWLLLGLVGALFSAELIGSFESRLQQTLLLAFFIPGIVYIADAVGTQTETVIVRGLSVGVNVGRVIRLELLSGIGIGIALAAVALPLIGWLWRDWKVAITVASAIVATCSIATLVALSLPWLLDRLHIDPAFGSGPLATVIQDMLSLLIYLGLAVVILA